MIPCNLCSSGSVPIEGQLGLKQRGKTKRDGTKFERFYVCQDCGALWHMVGDTATRTATDKPVFTVVRGGRA